MEHNIEKFISIIKNINLNERHYRALLNDNTWITGDLVKEQSVWGGMEWRYNYYISPFKSHRQKNIGRCVVSQVMEKIQRTETVTEFTGYYDMFYKPIYVGDICEKVFIADGYRDAVVLYSREKGFYLQEICKHCNETTTFNLIHHIPEDVSVHKIVKNIKIIGNVFNVPMVQ